MTNSRNTNVMSDAEMIVNRYLQSQNALAERAMKNKNATLGGHKNGVDKERKRQYNREWKRHARLKLKEFSEGERQRNIKRKRNIKRMKILRENPEFKHAERICDKKRKAVCRKDQAFRLDERKFHSVNFCCN